MRNISTQALLSAKSDLARPTAASGAGAIVVTIEEEDGYIASLRDAAMAVLPLLTPQNDLAKAKIVAGYDRWVYVVQQHYDEWKDSTLNKSEWLRALAVLPFTLWINSWASETARLQNELERWKAQIVNEGIVSAKDMPASKIQEPKSILDSSVVTGEYGVINAFVMPTVKIVALGAVAYLGFQYVSARITASSLRPKTAE